MPEERKKENNANSRITSPEQVDDYIRVTTPSMWLLALAMTALLLAGIVWAFAVKIQVRTRGADGEIMTEYTSPSSFLTDGVANGSNGD